MTDRDYYWYWLNNIPGIGRITMRKLLEEFGTPERIYRAGGAQIESLLPRAAQRESFHISKDGKRIEESYSRLAEKNIHFLHPDSPEYPKRLATIPDNPLGLYLIGKMPADGVKTVAIIGTRECTRYGSEMARYFGRELSKSGVAVISGLARGVDGMAHAGALAAGGYTLGVLGCGIDQVYPRENYRLFIDMERHGGILSESNVGAKMAPGLFPERNRLIAGMADAILVVEARERSGTFITVDQGLEQGREICALPGRVTDHNSVGCNRLIKMGAHIVTEVQDMLELLGVEGAHLSNHEKLPVEGRDVQTMQLSPTEQTVYGCLQIEPRYLDDIIEELQLAPQEVCMALNHLAVRGIIEEPLGNYYAIKL